MITMQMMMVLTMLTVFILFFHNQFLIIKTTEYKNLA